jgi:lysophospholipase L1-like esterase
MTLPPEYLDRDAPPDVVVTDTLRPPFTDPTLGVPLGPADPTAPPVPAAPAHALVTIGDSLTHGVSSGAVFRTDVSWPALVARALGVARFDVPVYRGPLDGLPVNLEALCRQVQKKFGTDTSLFEKMRLPIELQRILDRNEDYWERGEGSQPPRTSVRYHNVGIYGWDVRDALSYTAARAAAAAGVDPDDSLLGAKPEHDNDIAARVVLAPFGVDATQVDAARWHGLRGGIASLVVALGANNVLGTVVDKHVAWSRPGYDDIDRKGEFNAWRPTHFAAEYAQLVAQLRRIPARRVVLATVPHVTIAPIARGVNPQRPGEKWRPGSRYFPYYTDPWIADEDFKPSKHRHLTHQQARALDSAVDQYNDTIADAVRAARRAGRDWYLLDLCGLLDGFAHRRFAADPAAAAANHWVPRALPPALADLDTRFFVSDRRGRRQGGLFGLDGIHPTTSAYGIVAQDVLDVLAAAGVASTPIDFRAVRAADTLVSEPPALVGELLKLIAPFASIFVSRR